MNTVTVNIIHPTNDSSMEVTISANMLLRDVFNHLVDASFINEGKYGALIYANGYEKENVKLDINKTLSENNVENDDCIRIFYYYAFFTGHLHHSTVLCKKVDTNNAMFVIPIDWKGHHNGWAVVSANMKVIDLLEKFGYDGTCVGIVRPFRSDRITKISNPQCTLEFCNVDNGSVIIFLPPYFIGDSEVYQVILALVELIASFRIYGDPPLPCEIPSLLDGYFKFFDDYIYGFENSKNVVKPVIQITSSPSRCPQCMSRNCFLDDGANYTCKVCNQTINKRVKA